MKKALFLLVSFSVVVAILIGFSYFFPFPPDIPPAAPSLDNRKAEYRLLKQGNNYLVSYSDAEQKDFRIMIGTSPVELEPYIGKQVHFEGDYLRNEDGQIWSSNTQCIASQCHQIYKGENVDTWVINLISITALPE